MPSFNVSIQHEMSREQAVEKLHGFSERVKDEFQSQVSDLQETWDELGNLNFSLKAMGMAIKGDVVTDDDQVNVSGNLPFAALPFRGIVEKTISDKISEALTDS